MLESIVWIFLLSIATFLIVVAIPYAIKNATEAESNPEHLYNIFMKEAGWRGRHVICAVGCFLPITLFFNPHVKIEGIGVALLFVAYCFYEHIKLYAGVKIFNPKISIFLCISFCFASFVSAQVAAEAERQFAHVILMQSIGGTVN